VALNAVVAQGTKIGTVADMDANTHFHLGVRDDVYSAYAIRGALPRSACDGDPAYPEDFVDPNALSYDGCTAPPVPPLVSPANGASCQSPSVTLDWDPSAGGEGYDLQITTSTDCSGGLTYPLPDYSAYAPPGLQLGTTYYWRVRSKDECGAVSAWSSCWHFTTNSATPAQVSPANGAVCQSTGVTLDWNPTAGGDGYDLQVSTASDCSGGTTYGLPDYSSYAPPGLLDATTYYWRVRSKQSCGWLSDWSPCWSFSTSCVCPGREIPHSCVPSTQCYAAQAANVETLPEMSAREWRDSGQSAAGLLRPGVTYSVGFEYKAATTGELNLRLGGTQPSAELDKVICASNLPPSVDGEWRTFWSAPFTVTDGQLRAASSLRLSRSVDSDDFAVRNVRLLRYQ
jgi:hypothetical protein